MQYKPVLPKNPSILIIEDDILLSTSINTLLRAKFFTVKQAHSLERAITILDHDSFELIILDRKLPDGDGIELLESQGSALTKTRILVLSDKSSVLEKVTGLQKGADDYLAKPFASDELLLRVQSLLNKEKHVQIESLKCGKGIFLPALGLLECDQFSIQLRRREAQIFSCLRKYQNSTVSRTHLIDEVWQTEANLPTFSTIDVYIRRLRMKLKQDFGVINTVRGFGYRYQNQD